MSTKEIYRGDPNINGGEEETILSANTGKVFVRQRDDGSYLLGVDRDPDPEKFCRSVITLTELQREKLIQFLSFQDPCAQYEAVIRDLFDACDRLMGDSDLPDDNSPEMKAMKRAIAILKTRGEQ